MIFAAGMGTRLKPLTDVIPKALVPVGGKPLLQRVIERLSEAGTSHFVVNVHHMAGQIKNFLSITQPHFAQASGCESFTIQVSDETDALLETGGGIRKARPLFLTAEPILIHNVDILSNVDLAQFYSSIGNDDALLLVSSRKTKRYLMFDDDMRLVGWTNIATGEVRGRVGTRMYAFAGIHVIGQTLLSDMDTWPERFPIIDFYLDRCAERTIRGYVKEDLRLLDVGKLDTLAAAEEYF